MNGRKTKFGGTIRFKELMEQLNDRLTNLSDLVIDMIERGKTALLEDNESVYKELDELLDKVHENCYYIEDTIQSSLALHQPFAGDLRYILAGLKITNEIHRSAHDAVHIAHSTSFIELKQYDEILKKIGSLAEDSSDMFQKSVKAFQDRKALDFDVWQELDDAIDDMHKEIIIEITEIIEKDPKWTRAGTSLILTTRYIERIADHACNIVEESNFVVTGERGKIE